MSDQPLQVRETTEPTSDPDGAEARGGEPSLGRPPRISVILATYNRSESLRRALRSLAELSTPPELTWEVIVIDNRSADETREVVTGIARNSSIDVRYMFEARPGKSIALNTGIKAARGEILAFTDDDVVFDKEWLSQIVREVESHQEAAMYFGQTRPYAPDQTLIATRLGDSEQSYAFPCSPWECGNGNNMVARKSVVLQVGCFDVNLGPGTPSAAVEDMDLTYRVLRSGGMVRYSPRILAYHNHHRVSAHQVVSVRFGYAKGRGALFCKYILRGDLWAARMCYWDLLVLFRMLRKEPQRRGAALRELTGMLAGFAIWLIVDGKQLGRKLARFCGFGPRLRAIL